MTREERIYGDSSRFQPGNRTDDKVDAALIALAWRRETEPASKRANRYDTAKTASHAWLYIDQFREWSRHRGTSFQ
jgi:hypothetical protein